MLHRRVQPAFARHIEAAVTLDFARIEVTVAFLLALELARLRRRHTQAYGRRAFAALERGERFRRLGRDLDLHVDPVQQRPRDAALVMLYHVRAAAASAGRMAVIAARAGVHRGDQLETGGKFGLARRPRDRDAARFHWFAQHFEHAAFEFRQFIEKQHAAVGQ